MAAVERTFGHFVPIPTEGTYNVGKSIPTKPVPFEPSDVLSSYGWRFTTERDNYHVRPYGGGAIFEPKEGWGTLNPDERMSHWIVPSYGARDPFRMTLADLEALGMFFVLGEVGRSGFYNKDGTKVPPPRYEWPLEGKVPNLNND